jgi:hypothetical protein
MSDPSEEDLVVQLSGIIYSLAKGNPITPEDRKKMSELIRSARDQFMYPHLDPRIRKLEMWALVLVESSESKVISSGFGPDVHRTIIQDPVAFHLAVYKIRETHEEGIALRRAREKHISEQGKDNGHPR